MFNLYPGMPFLKGSSIPQETKDKILNQFTNSKPIGNNLNLDISNLISQKSPQLNMNSSMPQPYNSLPNINLMAGNMLPFSHNMLNSQLLNNLYSQSYLNMQRGLGSKLDMQNDPKMQTFPKTPMDPYKADQSSFDKLPFDKVLSHERNQINPDASEAKFERTTSPLRSVSSEGQVALEENNLNLSSKIVSKISTSKNIKKKIRVQPDRKAEVKSGAPQASSLAELIPEIQAIVGFQELEMTKVKELYLRSEKDPRKFFIKLKRNLYYYKKIFKVSGQ